MRYLLALLCVLTALVGLAGCERPEPPVADQSERPAKLFQVVARRATTRYEFVGRVEAAQTVDVSFEVPGELVVLPLREGQTVAAGGLIAALDPADFRLAVREAEVQLQLASQDRERKERLLAERGISQSLVDDARAAYELARVRLAQAQERLADSRILAPFDAYVARRFVDNRTRVRVGDAVARLLDLNELHVVASVPQDLTATATPERIVSLSATFDFLPDEHFPLEYRENTGEANAVAQTYQVTFRMPRPERWNILPGMTATVTVELAGDGAEADVVIPAGALQSGAGGGFYVWLFDPQTGTVSRRPVTVGVPRERGVAVTQGLADGDLIVAVGASQVQEGMRVHMLGQPITRI
ncbi:MAG: efflux RND transporter periplasmic adaptor subunit [Pseudomonadales bacterium]